MHLEGSLASAPRSLCLAALAAVLLLPACGNDSSSGGSTLRFQPPERSPLGTTTARGLVFVDVDGDGIPDAASVDEGSGRFLVARGLPGTGYGPAEFFTALPGAGPLAVADLDGDHAPDAVVGSTTATAVAIARNEGAGFGAPTTIEVGATLDALLSFDSSLDGRADLVGMSGAGGGLILLTMDPALPPLRAIPLGVTPGGLAAAHLDPDGRRDLIVTAANGNQLLLLHSTTPGRYATPIAVATPTLAGPVAVGDVDGDAWDDVLALGASLREAVLCRGTGTGALSAPETILLPGTANGLLLVDLDADGRQDLIVSQSEQVVVAYGDGSGTFPRFETIALDSTGVADLVAHDVDGDGRMDLAYVGGRSELALLRNPRPIQLGNVPYGTGTPDCAGTEGLVGNGRAQIGNLAYALVGTNAPPYSFGLLVEGGPADLTGSDPFGLGFLFHLGFDLLTQRFVISDHAGNTYTPEPIPANAALNGLDVHAQLIWFQAAGTCTSQGFSSSKGLTIRIGS